MVSSEASGDKRSEPSLRTPALNISDADKPGKLPVDDRQTSPPASLAADESRPALERKTGDGQAGGQAAP